MELLKSSRVDLSREPRLVILGVGNDLNGDDACGVMVVRDLSKRESGKRSNLLIVDAGHAPENVTGEVREFRPDIVIMIDAAEMGEQPGMIRWISMHEIDGISASTHSLPLSMLAKYLTLEIESKVFLLGIQPASTEMDRGVSAPVHRAVVNVSRILCKVI
jgi:hydrogenase 3 maturation protease